MRVHSWRRVFPTSIEIITCKVTSEVTVYHSINVYHGEDMQIEGLKEPRSFNCAFED